MERMIPIAKQYRSLPNMEKKFDRFARQRYFNGNTKLEFEAWKKTTKEHLWELLGMQYMEKCELMPVIEECVTMEDGITREKVIIQTEPDVWMPMYVLIPPYEKRANPEHEKMSCFIAPCGHQGAGKYSIAGLSEYGLIQERIQKFQYDYGLQMAKRGFVTICPDARGFGERRDDKYDDMTDQGNIGCSCYQLAHMAEPLGETVCGMNTWDLIRLIDYIEQRNEWRLDNLGCIGFSGGGMQTLWLAALDERIKQLIISGYFYGYKDSLLILNGNCNCNYIPHLWEYYDMGDIASLIAPRPVMIQSCREDHLNGPRGLDNVYEQLKILKKAYAFYEKEDKILHDIEEGGHSWHEEGLNAGLVHLGNHITK